MTTNLGLYESGDTFTIEWRDSTSKVRSRHVGGDVCAAKLQFAQLVSKSKPTYAKLYGLEGLVAEYPKTDIQDLLPKFARVT